MASRYVGGGRSWATNGSSKGVEDSLYGEVRVGELPDEITICGRDDLLFAFAVSMNILMFVLKRVIRIEIDKNATVNAEDEDEGQKRTWRDRTGLEKGQAGMSYSS